MCEYIRIRLYVVCFHPVLSIRVNDVPHRSACFTHTHTHTLFKNLKQISIKDVREIYFTYTFYIHIHVIPVNEF